MTTQELSIPFPVNSTNTSINITSPPKYGSIIISTISKTPVKLDVHLKNFAIERIFYHVNNDTCEQDSFKFQARVEYLDAVSQTWKLTDLSFDMVIHDPSIAFQELNLSLPSNSRDLRLNVIKKPVCGDITVSTIRIINGEQHFIQIEDLATTRVFYQKKFHDNFEFTAVADYFNESI